MNDDRISFRDALARAAVPLAALAAMAALAQWEVDPAGRAETVYLAVLATAGLLAVSFLAPPPAWEAGLGATLATTVVWALPAGPGRGAAVLVVLLGALAVAAGRRGGEGFLLPLAFGLQILLRGGELLFQPQLGLRTLVALLVLPAAVAAATALLARRHGPAALIAAGTAVLLAPGWNVAATLGLIALAAGDLLARPETGRFTKGAAVLVILAPIAWEPLPGLATAAAALVLARPREGRFIALAAAVGLSLFTMRDHTGHEWLPFLLLPASLLSRRGQGWSAAAGLALAIVVVRTPDISAMAAPLALLALAGGERGRPLQAAWTAALLGATCLLASYPWLRDQPLREALGLFGLPLTLAGSAAAVAVALILLLLARLRAAPVPLAAGALFLAACVQIPSPGTPFLPPATAAVVDAAHPSRRWDVEGRHVSTVVVETSLSNGTGLVHRTPVATMRLRARNGVVFEHVLRAGEETGEWAARRADVAASSVLRSPRPWISWVAGDFFGQRYRSLWAVRAPGAFTELTVERNPDLPPQVSLALHGVEIRP